MEYKINPFEEQYILLQFSQKYMARDMAMYFITQPIPIDRVFIMQYQIEPSFYTEVFKEILTYIADKIQKNRFYDCLTDIFGRLPCDNYSDIKEQNNIVNADYLISHLIESTAILLIRAGYEDQVIDLFDVCMQSGVDRGVIKTILINNIDLTTYMILSDFIQQERFATEDLYDIILSRHPRTADENVREIILNMTGNKENLLQFLATVMDRFRIMRFSDKIVCEPIARDNEELRFLRFLRSFLRDIIYTDCELDMANFLSESFNEYGIEEVNKRQYIYESYMFWLSSPERETQRVENYLNHGYEENDMFLSDQDQAFISTDAKLFRYICRMDSLDGYDLFVHAFNVNRFRLFQYDNFEAIRSGYKRIASMDEARAPYLAFGLAERTFLFLL